MQFLVMNPTPYRSA